MTSRTVAAVLFDMDGTLVDSTALVESIWTAFATRHDLDPATVIAYAHGRPTSATVHEFVAEERRYADELTLIHSAELVDKPDVREIPGAAALVAAIPPERMAIVTSASGEVARHRLSAVGITPPAILITADDVTEGKPSPQGYRAAMQALRAGAPQSIVFEDAEAGVLAGLASGATTIVVGAHNSPSTQGLSRIPDFRNVTAQSCRRGVELSW